MILLQEEPEMEELQLHLYGAHEADCWRNIRSRSEKHIAIVL